MLRAFSLQTEKVLFTNCLQSCCSTPYNHFSLDSSNYAAKIVALVHQNKHETIIGQLHADIYYFLKRSEINHNQSITHVNTSLPTVKIKENAF